MKYFLPGLDLSGFSGRAAVIFFFLLLPVSSIQAGCYVLSFKLNFILLTLFLVFLFFFLQFIFGWLSCQTLPEDAGGATFPFPPFSPSIYLVLSNRPVKRYHRPEECVNFFISEQPSCQCKPLLLLSGVGCCYSCYVTTSKR